MQEPFKQAYIARNFPGVTLFNDVVELAAAAEEAAGTGAAGRATTSFGGEKEIPRAAPGQRSVLVAGTSCKDFSARKRATGIKKDIEDMGTSGETFIATVDYLFATSQDVLLLENVKSAPWDKMASYITGRLELKTALKDIQSSQKGAEKKEDKEPTKGGVAETTFTLEQSARPKAKRLVVTTVASKVGLRVGVALRGHSTKKGGEVPLDVQALGLKPGGTIELKALVAKLGLSFSTAGDELLFDMPVTYHSHVITVDSKTFGLPHTRNRKYLLAWKPEVFGGLSEAAVGEHWQELVKGLQTELEHPVEAFLLPDSSDRIRRFRDVLRSPIAQRLAYHGAGDYYGSTRDADTRYNLGFRNCVHLLTQRDRNRKSVKDASILGANMDVKARPLTKWGPDGPPRLLSHKWMQEVISFWTQHSLDHVDVKAVKNAEAGVDMLHHNVLLDLSQNVHMTDVINRPGITGCLTPGGSMFHIRRGREICGFEKLLLSGIPADSLLLGGESEVQLSDLAGNAMSMPVVSACLLAAFCVQPYARARAAAETRAEGGESKRGKSRKKPAAIDASVLISPAPAPTLPPADDPPGGFEAFSFDSCVALAPRAERCSVLCTCESSGDVSKHAISRCSVSLLTTCGKCASRLQLETHDMQELFTSSERFERDAAADPAGAPADFEKELRRTVPDVLRLAVPLVDTGLGTELLRLTRVERERDVVTLRYVAYRGACVAAMLSVSFGRLEASGAGVKAVLFDLSTGARGPLPPAARLLYRASGAAADNWEVCKATETTLRFEALGDDVSPSFRAEMGLVDFAKEVWADRVQISGGGAEAVAGIYVRQPCRGVCAFGALWQREDRAVWLFIAPDVDRTASDRLVFATTPTYLDGPAHHVAELQLREDEPVLEWLHALGQTALRSPTAQPPAASAGKKQKKQQAAADDSAVVVPARLLQWRPQPAVQLLAPKGGPSVTRATAAGYPSFLVDGLPAETVAKLRESSTGDGRLSILASSSTVAERRLAESLASPLLRLAFEPALGEARPAGGAPAWGEDEVCAPRRPLEVWQDGRRVYDTEASNTYERRMSERPPPWEVQVKPGGSGAVEVRPRVPVVAHQAAEKVLRGRGLGTDATSALQVEWQVGTRLDARCELRFPICSSAGEPQAAQPPQAAGVWADGYKLYPRQLAVLRWMQGIEEGAIVFDERDFTDAQLPSVGWQLQAKAGIKGPLRGGVLADALGAGKTVTVIALVAADAPAARSLPLTPEEPRLSRASLIVVPPLIIRQWQAEIRRFSGGQLRCVRVESAEQLQKLSCAQLREADIVLIVSDLLGCEGRAVSWSKAADEAVMAQTSREADKEAARAKDRLAGVSGEERAQLTKSLDARKDRYLQLLTDKAGTEPLPPFLHRRNKNREAGGGDTETIIYGVWISNSSRDPFGKTKGRQEDREAAACFSHSYARVALPALRAKAFADDDTGVPIEWFVWRRVIIDECHEPLCMGADDADESAMSSKRSSCAVRELLGIALPDVAARPLVAQRGTFGLTGTPLLSSVARITELASLCAGTYVTGAANHWRMIERASGRDLFLRYHDAVPSRLYHAETVRSAQDFVRLAARRNVVEEAIECATRLVRVRLGHGSAYEKRCEQLEREAGEQGQRRGGGGMAPEGDVVGEDKYLQLVQVAAEQPERSAALASCVAAIHAKEPMAKVLVFAPLRGFGKAEKAVRALGMMTEVVRPGEEQERAAQLVLAFDEEPTELTYQQRCRVLLLAYEDGAGLNLQHGCHPGCHHVVLFAPLAGAAKDGEKVVAAVGKEQQSIGRVRRAGQQHLDGVTVHRLVLEGPKGERTVDGVLTDRNMDEELIRSATNTAEA